MLRGAEVRQAGTIVTGDARRPPVAAVVGDDQDRRPEAPMLTANMVLTIVVPTSPADERPHDRHRIDRRPDRRGRRRRSGAVRGRDAGAAGVGSWPAVASVGVIVGAAVLVSTAGGGVSGRPQASPEGGGAQSTGPDRAVDNGSFPADCVGDVGAASGRFRLFVGVGLGRHALARRGGGDTARRVVHHGRARTWRPGWYGAKSSSTARNRGDPWARASALVTGVLPSLLPATS